MTDREKFEVWINVWWPQTKGNLYFNNGSYTNNFVNYAWEGWQAALASQQPADYGWIEWAGGEQPVCDGILLDIKFRDDGVGLNNFAENWIWDHAGASDDIIAYRVVKP